MRHLSIFPWSMDSEPAERIREEMSNLLGYRVFKVYANKGFEPERGQAIIDWGRSDTPPWNRPDLKWLNHPKAVANSVDKQRTFECMDRAGVGCVPYTHDHRKAEMWIEGGGTVCCRTTTRGHDGEGLVHAKRKDELEYSPLYTLFIPAVREFRVYVFKDKIIDLLEKVHEADKIKSEEIRTETNGWGYARDGIYAPNGYQKEAIAAIKSCGLDFGGVDIILDRFGKYWVLETNTAPDVFRESARRFAKEMLKWLKEV